MVSNDASAKRVDERKLRTEFDRLKDAELNVIEETGLQTMCEELGVDPFEDTSILLVTFHMQATNLEAISWEQFLRGMTVMGASTIAELRDVLPSLRSKVDSDPDMFAAVYQYAYRANTSEGMQVITGEVAGGLLQLLLEPRWAPAGELARFIEVTKVRTVTRDTWKQVLALSRTHKPDLSDYDDAGAWPVLLDDFVAWLRAGKPEGEGGAAGGGAA